MKTLLVWTGAVVIGGGRDPPYTGSAGGGGYTGPGGGGYPAFGGYGACPKKILLNHQWKVVFLFRKLQN